MFGCSVLLIIPCGLHNLDALHPQVFSAVLLCISTGRAAQMQPDCVHACTTVSLQDP